MELRNKPIQSDQNNQITTLDQILNQKYGGSQELLKGNNGNKTLKHSG